MTDLTTYGRGLRALRLALIVRATGPGLTEADDLAAAWLELRRYRDEDRRALLSLPGGDAV